MEKSKNYIGHILTLTTIIIYSFNTNAMKILVPNDIGANALVLLRAITMAVCYYIVSLFIKDKGAKPTYKEKIEMMFLGLYGFGIQLICYVNGLELTGTIDTMVIRSFEPIMIIGIAAIFFKRKIQRNEIIGMILGVGGTVYISISPHTKGAEDSILGNSFVIISSFLAGAYLLFVKPYAEKFSIITLMKWVSFGAVIVTIPFGLARLIEAPILYRKFDWLDWGSIFYVTVITSFIGSWLAVISLRYMSALVKGAYFYLLPITGTLVTMMFKLQYPTWHDPIAFGIILAGFIVVNLKTKTKEEHIR